MPLSWVKDSDPGSDHPVRISNLWLIVMQRWADEGVGSTNHSIRAITFPNDACQRYLGVALKESGTPTL